MSALAERLCELTWQVEAQHYDELRRLIVAQGGTWDDSSDTPHARTIHGMMVGFNPPDPVTSYTQVCMALLGPLWPMVPEAAEGMRLMNRQWSERTKRAKAIQDEGGAG